jgi:hypothetical protein
MLNGSSARSDENASITVIVLNKQHLQQLLSSYLRYYHQSRTHLSLGKDSPEPRRYSQPIRARSSPAGRWASSSLRAPCRLSRPGVGCRLIRCPCATVHRELGCQPGTTRGTFATRTRGLAAISGQHGERGLHWGSRWLHANLPNPINGRDRRHKAPAPYRLPRARMSS